jgi:hypothetical protein
MSCHRRAAPVEIRSDKDSAPCRSAHTLKLLYQATAIEPDYSLALSLTAWCHAQQVVYNWAVEPASARTEALRLTQMAATTSGEDPIILTVLGQPMPLYTSTASPLGYLKRR